MELLQSDFRKGMVKVRLTAPEDAWHLTHIISPGDEVSGRTTRKIKIGTSANAPVLRKPMTVSILAEKVELDAGRTSLRVNGKILQGPEDVPKGSYHSLSLEEGMECTVQKEHWQYEQKQKLQEACEQSYEYLLCLLDREKALLARTRGDGYELLAELKGEVATKRYGQKARHDFYTEIRSSLELYAERLKPEVVIIASPAFYKEELHKKLPRALQAKTVIVTCSDVHEAAFSEVMRSPQLEKVLQASRLRRELLLAEELLREIHKAGMAVYGWKEVERAAALGAIRALLLTSAFLRQKQAKGDYAPVDALLNALESQQSEIHFISTEEAAKSIDGLGGIAALLRYRIPAAE